MTTEQKGELIALVDETDDASHWSPASCVEFVAKLLGELGGSTLVVALVDKSGTHHVWRAGTSANVTLLAQKTADYELRTFEWSADDG